MNAEKKTPRDARILSALLVSESYEAAATTAGVGVSTVRRRLEDPDFRRRLRELSGESVEVAKVVLRRLAGRACVAVNRALTCGRAGVELRAAGMVLDSIARLAETDDFAERLAALEARQAAADAGGPKLHRGVS